MRELASLGILTAAMSSSVAGVLKSGPSQVDFNRDVRPILAENCFKCHGPDDEARKAKLRLDLRAEALKPAKSGESAIVPGAPGKSQMMARITAADLDERMPPLKSGKKLNTGQIELLRKWIAQGAPYATHWAYAKPFRPALPEVRDKRWSRNAVDRFIFARLKNEGLRPSLPSDRLTLIRRVSLDLTGLPPTLEEVDQFVKDKNPRAYEDLVDRLLEKPGYGEHWARMWLDLARYADSAGYADDPPRTIWAFRDYVIRAFNANKPFDRFTLEQIAGDLLADADEEEKVGTAFHRNTMTNNEGGTTDEEFRNAAVVDRVNTTMSVWMATSMGCAQCHTHKYDPITQQEYFRFFAFFNNTADADLQDESPVLEFFSAEQKEQRIKLQAEIAGLQQKIKSSSPSALAAQSEWEQNFPRDRKWLSPKPASLKARDGGTIVLEENNAFRIAPRQKKEVYTLELPLELQRLAGLRIEALPLAPSPEAKDANRDYSITHVTATLVAPATNRLAGRFVRIELPGKEKFLSLAEVQVFNRGTNLALAGVAFQSSTAFEGPARLAIDGNTDGDFEKAKSTTHTEGSENPWWEVDLKSSQPIDQIVVWNRTDNDLQSRLADFRIAALDENRQPVWEKKVKSPPNPSAVFDLDGTIPLKFIATFDEAGQGTSELKSVIEEPGAADSTGWVVSQQDGKRQYLTLLPEKPINVAPGSKLQVVLNQVAKGEHVSALLRMEISDDERLSEYAALPDSILKILALNPVERSVQQRDGLAEYFRANLDPHLQPERERLAGLTKELASLAPKTVPIMRELPEDKRRKTRIQFRGNYLALGDEVTEAVPAAFHTLPAGAKPDRLGVARWLVDENNPLTARVIANRFWEQIFGVGIVRTSEDFGTQGDRPTHPALLDWLATELVSQKWNVKQFLKLLVTSETYCQSSRVTPQLLERDPDNLLLARGPRFRASAEVIRDQALAVSGLLSPKMFGPSVRPPQPSLGLTAAFGSSLDWKPSEGEDRYRRALYVEWRRTSPFPSMATFDAPNREVCALRRPRSNTPLQALVTLNDPVYIEAAQALARRMSELTGTTDEKIRYGFRLCLARPPRKAEAQRLLNFFEEARAKFQREPEQARLLTGNPAEKSPEDGKFVELAAWTAVANVLLNLDEMMMKP